MATPIQVYGHWVSQPTRAVLWALSMKNIPFDFHRRDPPGGDGDKDDYLKLFPCGLFPGVIDGDIRLTESNAILVHFAETRGWHDWYPKDDPAKRAGINQWLHWHHGHSRYATLKFFRPVLRATMGQLPLKDVKPTFAEGRPYLETTCKVLKHGAFVDASASSSPSGTATKKFNYLCGDEPTLADIATYCEFDQLEAFGLLNESGVAAYPEIIDWMGRMKTLPEHDAVRQSLSKLGKLARGTMAKVRALDDNEPSL